MPSNSLCNHTRDWQMGLPLLSRPIYLISCMIIDQIRLHSFVLPLFATWLYRWTGTNHIIQHALELPSISGHTCFRRDKSLYGPFPGLLNFSITWERGLAREDYAQGALRLPNREEKNYCFSVCRFAVFLAPTKSPDLRTEIKCGKLYSAIHPPTAILLKDNTNLKCSHGLQRSSLILDIHVMTYWHLSKQGIPWPVSRDHSAGTSS